jgi:hypothetical protein
MAFISVIFKEGKGKGKMLELGISGEGIWRSSEKNFDLPPNP